MHRSVIVRCQKAPLDGGDRPKADTSLGDVSNAGEYWKHGL